VAGFYERTYPAAARPPQPPGGLRVLLATAQLLNPDETLEACRKWTPPGASVPAACEGTDFADGGMPGNVAALRRADLLVGVCTVESNNCNLVKLYAQSAGGGRGLVCAVR